MKFKKAIATNKLGYVFVELADGMGAEICIPTENIELKPMADSRVYIYNKITEPTDEEIEKVKKILKYSNKIERGFQFEEFYNDEELRREIINGIRFY